MKRIAIIAIGTLVSILAFSQEVSISLTYVDVNMIRSEIEAYVNEEIVKWQQQGKFESSEDYKNRVSTLKRQEKINELTYSRLNSIASKVINLSVDNIEYDPDNEVYKISFVGLPAIYIKIPKSNNEASNFEKNLSKLIFSNPTYTLTDQGFAILGLNIINPTNRKIYKYNYQDNLSFGRNIVEAEYDPVNINIGEFKPNTTEQQNRLIIEKEILVDYNIPKTTLVNPNAFAVIVGNSAYEKTGSVKYAVKDAQTIYKYLVNVLGFQEGNIFYKENANKGFFEEIFGSQNNYKGRLFNSLKEPSKSEIFIYYSGHGAPGLRDKKGYFVPIECDPIYVELTGYSQELLIDNLSKIQAKSVTLILDACFSGANILDNISSIFPEVSEPIYKIENGVMLSSSKANQVSSWYDEMQHGLFTYFFLKGIRDTKKSDKNSDGILTYQELFEYISDNSEGVPYFARKLNNVEQYPTIQGNASNHTLLKY
jgi:hypothetical protein